MACNIFQLDILQITLKSILTNFNKIWQAQLYPFHYGASTMFIKCAPKWPKVQIKQPKIHKKLTNENPRSKSVASGMTQNRK